MSPVHVSPINLAFSIVDVDGAVAVVVVVVLLSGHSLAFVSSCPRTPNMSTSPNFLEEDTGTNQTKQTNSTITTIATVTSNMNGERMASLRTFDAFRKHGQPAIETN